jgi:quinol monooxygenase YgiN
VVRDCGDSNKFHFYEVYVDMDAIERHKQTPHFKAWTDFRESGGVVNFSVIKSETVFFQG